MPVYDYRCEICDSSTWEIKAVSERNAEVQCGTCGEVMARIPSVPSKPKNITF